MKYFKSKLIIIPILTLTLFVYLYLTLCEKSYCDKKDGVDVNDSDSNFKSSKTNLSSSDQSEQESEPEQESDNNNIVEKHEIEISEKLLKILNPNLTKTKEPSIFIFPEPNQEKKKPNLIFEQNILSYPEPNKKMEKNLHKKNWKKKVNNKNRKNYY